MPPAALRWIREQICFLLVLAVMVAAFGYLVAGNGHWVRSTALMGAAMLLAGLFRAAVPPAHTGMLNVRGRWVDTTVYLTLGALILAADIRLHR
jgi:hypothetical protein